MPQFAAATIRDLVLLLNKCLFLAKAVFVLVAWGQGTEEENLLSERKLLQI